MLSDDIPDDLREFAVTYIDSIAHLEALFLLSENPTLDWTSEACAQRLYIPESQAVQVLGALNESGLLAVTEQNYRFCCRTKELELMVLRLAALYRRELISVTNLIHFKLRKEP